MGAEYFATTALGKDASAAFDAAVSQAQWEHGHGGYSGTIAEKGLYVLVKPGYEVIVHRLMPPE